MMGKLDGGCQMRRAGITGYMAFSK